VGTDSDPGFDPAPTQPAPPDGASADLRGAAGVQVGSDNFQFNIFYGDRARANDAEPGQFDQRIPALVREYLLKHPQPDTLSVVSRNHSEARAARINREAYPLENGEDLIAFWQFKRSRLFSSDLSGLAFTSHSIRIFERKNSSGLRIHIFYRDFNRYTFTCKTKREWRSTSTYGGNSIDTYALLIDGPNKWSSPVWNEHINYVAEGLNYIKKIAATGNGASSSQH
jgi:hypothetical protein